MQFFKSQKGSVTVFVLVSCLLFIGCVVCVNIYIQSKQVAIDREYMQIRQNYETDTNSLENTYYDLYQKILEEEERKRQEEEARKKQEEENQTQENPTDQEIPGIEENITN